MTFLLKTSLIDHLKKHSRSNNGQSGLFLIKRSIDLISKMVNRAYFSFVFSLPKKADWPFLTCSLYHKKGQSSFFCRLNSEREKDNPRFRKKPDWAFSKQIDRAYFKKGRSGFFNALGKKKPTSDLTMHQNSSDG